jgi:hypothetical protein
MLGVGAQLHVGEGQVATVGNGGGFVEKSLGDARNVFLAIILGNMAAGEIENRPECEVCKMVL